MSQAGTPEIVQLQFEVILKVFEFAPDPEDRLLTLAESSAAAQL